MKTSVYIILLLSIFQISAVVDSGKTLPAKEFKAKLEATKGILIDVRTPEEFLCACIPGAVNINLQGKLWDERIGKLDKTKTYFLYDGTGMRSGAAMEAMSKAGFKKLFDLKDGLMNWEKLELPMIGAMGTCDLGTQSPGHQLPRG